MTAGVEPCNQPLVSVAAERGADTAVALFVFNRPAQTEAVLAAIRTARPPRMLVVADGPRPGRDGEAERCRRVREIVRQGIDWPCDVRTNFADVNLGCGRRLSSGLDWVFAQASAAVVLEDDCLPDPTFFPFCGELLARYRHDSRIGQICGSTFIAPQLSRDTSYVFSRYGPGWGWASWARAWKTYDFEMRDWPALRATGALRDLVCGKREARVRGRWYDDLAAGRIDTWDFQWTFAKLRHGLLSIIPTRNLVTNIGLGADATHTRAGSVETYQAQPMEFPLVHPGRVALDDDYDLRFSARVAPSWLMRARRRLGRVFR